MQEGSRAAYRLVIAGDATAVDRFVGKAKPALARGQRLETIGQARPEIRSALDRAGRFLGLAALVSVVLAAVAVAMAARRHSQRHLSGAAVMRCLGASQRTLVGIHVGEMLLLGLLASALGVAIAFALQWAVADWLARALSLSIPPAGWLPAVQGLAVGMVVLLAFGAPPVLALRRVSGLRVLRRDLNTTEPSAWLVAIAGIAGMTALLWWYFLILFLMIKGMKNKLGGIMMQMFRKVVDVHTSQRVEMVDITRLVEETVRSSALQEGLVNIYSRHSTSAVVINENEAGLVEDFLVALDARTGRERWRRGRDEPTSWSTPLIVTEGARPQVVVGATNGVRGYDLETGELLWEAPGLTANAIPSPVFADGMVYAMSGFRGNALRAVRLRDAKGLVAGPPGLVYRYDKDTPYVPSPLLYRACVAAGLVRALRRKGIGGRPVEAVRDGRRP